MDYEKALARMAQGHSELLPLNWDQFLNISLYMDQVISYTEQTLSPLKRSPAEKLLTKAMINNYSKDGLLHPTERKRYAREHLALIFMIYFLKQTLSIPDVRSLLDVVRGSDFEARYAGFDEALHTAMGDLDGQVEELARRVSQVPEDGARALIYDETIRLAMEAYARKRMVERMIDLMKPSRGDTPAKG